MSDVLSTVDAGIAMISAAVGKITAETYPERDLFLTVMAEIAVDSTEQQLRATNMFLSATAGALLVNLAAATGQTPAEILADINDKAMDARL